MLLYVHSLVLFSRGRYYYFLHFRDEEPKTLKGHELAQSRLTTRWWNLDL